MVQPRGYLDHIILLLRLHAYHVRRIHHRNVVFSRLRTRKPGQIHLVRLEDFCRARLFFRALNIALDSPSQIPVCYTMEYFQDPSDNAPLRGYGCYITALTLMIYKSTSVAASATTASTTSATAATTTISSSIDTLNGISQPSFTPSPTTTASQQASAPPTRRNSAWIAGPVVGAFAGGAIIVGVAFWIWSLYRRLAQSQGIIQVAENGIKTSPQTQQSPSTMPATGTPQELVGHRLVEAPATELRPELPGSQSAW